MPRTTTKKGIARELYEIHVALGSAMMYLEVPREIMKKFEDVSRRIQSLKERVERDNDRDS